jgi:hypothetical protein
VIAGFGASWAAAGCTKSAYVIGALCPAGDAGGSIDPRCATPGPVTFSVGLDRSGASLLDDPLTLPSGPVAATFRLRGERATATTWPVEPAGALARGAGAPGVGLAAPFTDGTLAVGLAAAAAPTFVAADATVGAVGADDFALEIVLRAAAGATLLDKRAGATGWSLATDAASHLVLTLDDADPTHLVQVASEPLTSGAWYDCMAWISHAGFARVDCDGRDRGALVTLPALGTLDSSAILAVGGGVAASRTSRSIVSRRRRSAAARIGSRPTFGGSPSSRGPGRASRAATPRPCRACATAPPTWICRRKRARRDTCSSWALTGRASPVVPTRRGLTTAGS